MNRRRNEKEHLKRKLEEHFEELDIIDGIDALGSQKFSSKKLFLKLIELQFKDNENKFDVVPKVYLCGTLWHETRGEMIQILKSVMRMDIDQSARKKAKDYFNVKDPDIYEVECKSLF